MKDDEDDVEARDGACSIETAMLGGMGGCVACAWLGCAPAALSGDQRAVRSSSLCALLGRGDWVLGTGEWRASVQGEVRPAMFVCVAGEAAEKLLLGWRCDRRGGV